MIGPTSIAIFLTASLAAPVGASTDDQSEAPNQRWIELAIGRDLQFIRINGTLVGGLAGMLLYLLGRLF